MRTPIISLLFIVLTVGAAQPAVGFDQFHGATPVEKLNYDSLSAAATPLTESDAGRALRDSCLARYGGVEKLAKLESFRLTYRMKAFLNRDTVDVVKSFRSDRRYRISRRSNSGEEVRILNGQRAWFHGRDTLMELSDGRYRAELFSWLTLAMPSALTAERFDEVRFGTRPQDSLAYFYLVKSDTLIIVLGVDRRDYLIKSSEGVIRQGESNFVFINWFADFHQHDGFWFPHQLVNVSMGLEVARSVVTNVEVNVGFAEDEFLPNPRIDPRTAY